MEGFMRAVVFFMALAGCAGSRYVLNTPHQINARNPTDAFETALATVRGEGYTVTELDPQRGFFRVKAKVDGDLRGHLSPFGGFRLTERVTYLSFQVQPSGAMTIFAAGYHVHDEKIHVKVAQEIEQLAACIQQHASIAMSSWNQSEGVISRRE
jgi:hypothetical protein